MGKKIGLFIMIFVFVLLGACQSKDNTASETEDELHTLDVAFEVPETADVDEEVELKATVTYGDEKVADADDVEFEYWQVGHEDDSTLLDVKNNGDGSYTQTVSFDENGEYEMYAHVTAKELHTMPKKAITVGEGNSDSEDNEE